MTKHANRYAADATICAAFARSLKILIPDFFLNENEVAEAVRTLGVDGFTEAAGGDAAALAETAALLTAMWKGGGGNE
jgi:hypothetical protein